MANKKPSFECRYEEIVPLAKLVRAHYLRDAADFTDLLPDEYNEQFLPGYDARVAAADAVVRTRAAQAETQGIGQRLAAAGAALPRLLNRLEARARRAENLTVPLKKLGIREVRTAYESGDLEALDTEMKLLLRHLDANAAALAAKSHTAADTETLRTLHQTLMEGNTDQDISQTGSQRLTAANVQILTELYGAMKDVLADGKSLYRGEDPVKLKDYTLTELLKRVRRERGEEKPEA